MGGAIERLLAREGVVVALGMGRRKECQNSKEDPSKSQVTGSMD